MARLNSDLRTESSCFSACTYFGDIKQGVRTYGRFVAFFLKCFNRITQINTKDGALYLNKADFCKWCRSHKFVKIKGSSAEEQIDSRCSHDYVRQADARLIEAQHLTDNPDMRARYKLPQGLNFLKLANRVINNANPILQKRLETVQAICKWEPECRQTFLEVTSAQRHWKNAINLHIAPQYTKTLGLRQQLKVQYGSFEELVKEHLSDETIKKLNALNSSICTDENLKKLREKAIKGTPERAMAEDFVSRFALKKLAEAFRKYNQNAMPDIIATMNVDRVQMEKDERLQREEQEKKCVQMAEAAAKLAEAEKRNEEFRRQLEEHREEQAARQAAVERAQSESVAQRKAQVAAIEKEVDGLVENSQFTPAYNKLKESALPLVSSHFEERVHIENRMNCIYRLSKKEVKNDPLNLEKDLNKFLVHWQAVVKDTARGYFEKDRHGFITKAIKEFHILLPVLEDFINGKIQPLTADTKISALGQASFVYPTFKPFIEELHKEKVTISTTPELRLEEAYRRKELLTILHGCMSSPKKKLDEIFGCSVAEEILKEAERSLSGEEFQKSMAELPQNVIEQFKSRITSMQNGKACAVKIKDSPYEKRAKNIAINGDFAQIYISIRNQFRDWQNAISSEEIDGDKDRLLSGVKKLSRSVDHFLDTFQAVSLEDEQMLNGLLLEDFGYTLQSNLFCRDLEHISREECFDKRTSERWALSYRLAAFESLISNLRLSKSNLLVKGIDKESYQHWIAMLSSESVIYEIDNKTLKTSMEMMYSAFEAERLQSKDWTHLSMQHLTKMAELIEAPNDWTKPFPRPIIRGFHEDLLLDPTKHANFVKKLQAWQKLPVEKLTTPCAVILKVDVINAFLDLWHCLISLKILVYVPNKVRGSKILGVQSRSLVASTARQMLDEVGLANKSKRAVDFSSMQKIIGSTIAVLAKLMGSRHSL